MDKSRKFLQWKVYCHKYIRIFVNSNGMWKILSTFIITSLVLLSNSEQAFFRYDETRTTGFAIVCACIWTGLFNSIEIFCSERNSIKQEHKSGNVDYSVFLGAHMMVEFLLCLVEAIIISGLVVFVHGQRFEVGGSIDLARIISLGVSVFLIVYTADILGLMISALVKTNKMAMTIMPFALIFQLVLSGFIFELEGWKKILSNLTIAKWGLRALGISIDFNTMITELPESQAAGYSLETKSILDSFVDITRKNCAPEYGPEKLHLLRVFLVLVFFIAMQTWITRYALSRIDRDER